MNNRTDGIEVDPITAKLAVLRFSPYLKIHFIVSDKLEKPAKIMSEYSSSLYEVIDRGNAWILSPRNRLAGNTFPEAERLIIQLMLKIKEKEAEITGIELFGHLSLKKFASVCAWSLNILVLHDTYGKDLGVIEHLKQTGMLPDLSQPSGPVGPIPVSS